LPPVTSLKTSFVFWLIFYFLKHTKKQYQQNTANQSL